MTAVRGLGSRTAVSSFCNVPLGKTLTLLLMRIQN